jgi:hypothetical protein
MVDEKVFLLVPEAPTPESKITAPAASRLSSASLRVGYLDNGKGNADHLLQFIRDGLEAELVVTSGLSLRKQSVSLPASQALVDRFVKEADLVISAMAD